MKKLIIIFGILSMSIMSCKAQHIIPVEDTYEYIGSEGGFMGNHSYVYVKDINNILSKFVGTWKGFYNSKNYEFFISEITTDDGELKKDELLLRYKITDTNGSIIETTLSLPNDSSYVLKNGYVDDSKGYVFSYIGRNIACGQNGWVFTQVYGENKDKLQVFLSVEGEMYPECRTGPAEQILPLTSTTFTKQ